MFGQLKVGYYLLCRENYLRNTISIQFHKNNIVLYIVISYMNMLKLENTNKLKQIKKSIVVSLQTSTIAPQ